MKKKTIKKGKKSMFDLSLTSKYVSRSISAENFTGEKGKGGMAEDGNASYAARELGRGWKVSPYIIIGSGETFELASIDGPGMIRHIWETDNAPDRRLILRIYWEGSEKPSVETPLNDFFASADAASNGYAPISSLPVCVGPRRGFNCYWEMPFFRKCRITLENTDSKAQMVYYQIDYVLGEIPENSAYFHAQFRRVDPLPYKEVYTILDNVKGNGHYVGTYIYWGSNNNGWWGEGEVKFYLDGDGEFPTICTTGTEDYFGGSWNFDVDGEYREFSTLYSGLPRVARPDGLYKSNQRFSLYRWHIPDPVYFKEDIKVTVQALGWRSDGRYHPLCDDISSVAFWYQDTPCETFPALPTPDELEII